MSVEASTAAQAPEHVGDKVATRGWMVSATRPVRYQVLETRGLFEPANPTLLAHFGARGRRRALVVIDDNVDRFHGQGVRTWFERHDVEARYVRMAAAENEKTLDNVLRISRAMHAFGLSRRNEPLLGIGGGVLLDLVGFAASLYRRGVPYVRVPTTLIGLVDAGVGVKTGVNFDQHKNRLGSYYAPVAAYLDRCFLASLDERHMANGMAEILKMALVRDARLFELLERHAHELIAARLQGGVGHDEVFARAIQGMLEELEPNLWEDELERRVDYGHSFSPVLEMQALPELLHGEAVGIDMILSLLLSLGRGLVTPSQLERVVTLMRALDLPIYHSLVTPDLMWQALQDTVCHRDGLQRLPLTRGIGACVFVNDVSRAELEEAVTRHRRLGAPGVRI